MSCCGDQRSVFRQEVGSAEQNDPGFWTARSHEFEYSGNGELTVTGPLSGVIYHFSANSRRVLVHGSDVPSLVSVPGLKPVY